MNPTRFRYPFRRAALGAAALSAVPVFAATIPFTNSFDSVGFTNTTFAAPSGGQISLSTTGTAAVAQYGTEQFTNLLGRSFTVETSVNVVSFGSNDGGDTTVGFVLFANNAGAPASSGTNFLLADWTYLTNSTTAATDGRLRFLNFTGTTNVAVGTNGRADDVAGNITQAAVAGTGYTLRLTATNVGLNTYDLSLGVFSGVSQIGTSASYTGFVSTNEFFGLRARNARSGVSTGTQAVAFESFSVIPEPSAFAMLAGFGALGFAVSRRRRG